MCCKSDYCLVSTCKPTYPPFTRVSASRVVTFKVVVMDHCLPSMEWGLVCASQPVFQSYSLHSQTMHSNLSSSLQMESSRLRIGSKILTCFGPFEVEVVHLGVLSPPSPSRHIPNYVPPVIRSRFPEMSTTIFSGVPWSFSIPTHSI